MQQMCCVFCDTVLCDNVEGWDGVGGGKEIQEGGDIRISMADAC